MDEETLRKIIREELEKALPKAWPVYPTLPATPIPAPVFLTRCGVCGIDLSGVMGYACGRVNCPRGGVTYCGDKIA